MTWVESWGESRPLKADLLSIDFSCMADFGNELMMTEMGCGNERDDGAQGSSRCGMRVSRGGHPHQWRLRGLHSKELTWDVSECDGQYHPSKILTSKEGT
jgi:hypothetical protein